MKRRQFLQQIGFTSATTVGLMHSCITHSQASSPKRLVVIFLRGAVDGLSVVIPYREAAYYRARPTIAIPQPGRSGGAIDLDGNFGLHPALEPLMALWHQGSLAFIHACGSPDETRSHFDAQDYMESGTPGSHSTTSGWMNRLLAALPGDHPMRAVSVGAAIPRIFQGQQPIANLLLGANATRPLAVDQSRIAAEFDRLYPPSSPLSQAYHTGLTVRHTQLNALADPAPPSSPASPADQPDRPRFAQTAQQLARLIVKEPQLQLAFVALEGWDTHVDQGAGTGELAARLQDLGAGLAALVQGLGAVYADTAIVVLSEFGRTVQENGNGGTDHGHGNAMWVLGGCIRGGKVYGDWRGLEANQLHEGRDLPVTTDFRDPLLTLLQQHMQLQSTTLQHVFPAYTLSRRLEII